jgi:hypothetical protein
MLSKDGLMDNMENFVKIIQIIIWPSTVVILAYIFRRPLSDLVSNIRTIRYKDFEAKFSKKLDDLKRDAKNLPCFLDVAVSDAINVKEATLEEILDSRGLDFYTKLAKVDPRSAVTEAWRKLELTIREKIKIPSAKQNIGRAIEILEKQGLIDPGEKYMLNELRELRNQATHAASFELTFLDAVKYAELASRLACYIQDRKL